MTERCGRCPSSIDVRIGPDGPLCRVCWLIRGLVIGDWELGQQRRKNDVQDRYRASRQAFLDAVTQFEKLKETFHAGDR